MSVADGTVSSHGGSGAGGSSIVQITTGGRDEVDAGASYKFWNGFFGTLYTVNKGRKSSILFFTFKHTMEFLQLFLLLLRPEYGWEFNTSSKAWQFVEFIQVRPFVTLIGHSLFVVFFVAFFISLVICLAMYGWVYSCFQSNRFDYEWPLRILRVYGATFFESIDIMSVSLLLTAVDCRYYGWPKEMRLHNNAFPALSCLSMPSVLYFMLGIIGAIILIVLAGFNKLAQMDLNPATRNLDAYAHPSTELWGFAIKMLMVLASIFLGDFRHLAIFWLISSVVLCYFFWKWEPMAVSWVNYLRTGTYSAVVYASCLFMALQFPPDSIKAAHRHNVRAPSYIEYVKALEIALCGVVPAFAVGALASYLRLSFFRVVIANRFKAVSNSNKSLGVYRFTSAREVEIVSRCCRVWINSDELQPEAVALAEQVFKAGLMCQPHSAFMVIWYTSFLVDVQGSYQSGFTQLQVALKLDPSFIDKYAIFSREQDHAQKYANGCKGQMADMLSDVEFQRSYRLAMYAHKEVLEAMRAFWRLLQHAKVHFEELTHATHVLDGCIKHADETYRSVLQRHADKPLLLRMYAKFLERVKHDPWGASRFIAEAVKLEQKQGESLYSNVAGLDDDGGDLGTGRISLFAVGPTGEELALCVFNSHGLMTMTNEAMRGMFGYGKAELKGKSVGMLLPPPFSEQQLQRVRNFANAGCGGATVLAPSEVVAVHKDHHMFGARITVLRISGVGEDSIFLASLEAVATEADTATVWLLPNEQVLAVDSNFCDWFGERSEDVEGGSISAWSLNSKPLDRVLKDARHSLKLANQAAFMAASKDSANEDPFGQRTPSHTGAASSAAHWHMESIAQALADAALSGTAVTTSATTSEWGIKGVRVRHRFAEPCDVDIKVTNTRPSAFSMHILTVRRSSPPAEGPMPHMLVTGPGGAVVHVTTDFATLLGTTPKELMANGSSGAMEAMMVQPFGLMHRVGLLGSIPSQQPPAYSCRSGLSVLIPMLGMACPEALPFKMQMKKRANLDEIFFVCKLQETSWEQALDERSLLLDVDELGVVVSVGGAPASLFGFSADVLVGHSVTCCLPSLQGTSPGPVLRELSARSKTAPGLFWRVGVSLGQTPEEGGDMESSHATDGGTSAFKPTKMVAAVMTVTNTTSLELPGLDLHVASEGAAHLGDLPPIKAVRFTLRLWRADIVTSVVEVDSQGLVVEPEPFLDKLYPAGATLGVGAPAMIGHHIRDFLPLDNNKLDQLYEDGAFAPVVPTGALAEDPAKKSNMKLPGASADRSRVGPKALLKGHHRLDGLEIQFSVQIVRKSPNGAYLVIHLVNPLAGSLHVDADRDFLHDVNIVCPGGVAKRFSTTAPSLAQVAFTRTSVGSRAPPIKSVSMQYIAGSELHKQATAHGPSELMSVGAPASPLSHLGAKSIPRTDSNAAANAWALMQGSTPRSSPRARPDLDTAEGHGSEDWEDKLGTASATEIGSIVDDADAGGDETDAQIHIDAGAGLGQENRSGRPGQHKSSRSEVSEMDEADTAADDSANYKRGQRFKKLTRMLTSSQVFPDTNLFKWQTLVISFLVAVASIVVYIVFSRLMRQQIQSVDNLYYLGQLPRKLMRMVVSVLDISQHYQPYPNQYLSPTLPGLSNDGADLVARYSVFSAALEIVADLNTHAYVGFNQSRRMPTAFGLRALWETPTLDEVDFFLTVPTEKNVDPVTFLLANTSFSAYELQNVTAKISLFDGVNRVVAAGRNLLANGQWYNDTFVTRYSNQTEWIDWTIAQYICYNSAYTFVSGCFTTMDGFARTVIQAALTLNHLQIIITIMLGVLFPTIFALAIALLANMVDKRRHNMFSIFVMIPTAMVRRLASQAVSLDVDDDSDDDMDDSNALRGVTGAVVASGHADDEGESGKRAKTGVSGASKGVQINVAGEAEAIVLPSPTQSGWDRMTATLLFWKNKTHVSAPKRRLLRSWSGVFWLAWPFMLWGVVTTIIDVMGHKELQSVDGPLMTFNTVNFVQVRLLQLVYSTQLMLRTKDTAATSLDMSTRLIALKLEYQALLFGGASVSEQLSQHFTGITQGISNRPGAGQHILYELTGCMASTPNYCLLPTDPFYQYTVHGFDQIMRHLFDVAENIVLLLDAGVVVDVRGPEMQWMWKMRECAVGGTNTLVDAYQFHVKHVYTNTMRLQTMALAWTLIMLLVNLIFLIRPYLATVDAETRRVTELLTQLPADIDVEGLVQRSLLKGIAGKQSPSGSASAAVSSPGQVTTSMNSTLPLLAYKPSGSAVMRRAASLTSAPGSGHLAHASGPDLGSISSIDSPFLREQMCVGLKNA